MPLVSHFLFLIILEATSDGTVQWEGEPEGNELIVSPNSTTSLEAYSEIAVLISRALAIGSPTAVGTEAAVTRTKSVHS